MKLANRLKSIHASLLCLLALNGFNPSLLAGPTFLYRKDSRGQTLPLAIVIAFFIILVGLGIFFLQMILGGSREVQNAVDSGTLQVAKKALSIVQVPLTPTEITEFAGVALKDASGQFYVDLETINRIWGVALMDALNVEKMQSLGLSTPAAVAHAQTMNALASGISNRLTTALLSDNDPKSGTANPLHSAFHGIANVNSVRMVNPGGVVSENDYLNSYTYRLNDSNMQFNASQLGTSLLSLGSVTAGLPMNGNYLQGYASISVPLSPPLQYMFVPLDHSKKPHLISQARFDSDISNKFIPAPITSSVPPDAFRFGGDVIVQKANQNIHLRAYAASQDMTPGYYLQNARGFIRVENLPGVGPASLHVIDEASSEIISSFGQGGGPPGATANTVWIRSLFNPVETIYSVGCPTEYDSDARLAAAIACGVMCTILLVGGALPFGGDGTCAAAFAMAYWVLGFPDPVGAYAACMACCASWMAMCWGIETPNYCGSGPPISSERPMYGFLPAVSMPGTGTVHNGGCGPGGTLARITPINESFHRVFYDWLNGDTAGELGCWVMTFVTHGMVGLKLCHPSGGIASPFLSFPVAGPPSQESGMRNRVPPFPGSSPLSSFNISLFNGGSLANFTQPGSLNSLLSSRTSDPNVKRIYDLLVQRIEEIAPAPPNATPADLATHDAEVKGILSSNKPIDLGQQAFIYLDDATGKLTLSVLPKDSLPAWLTSVQGEAPDGIDFHNGSPTQFEYPQNHPTIDQCYRLVDPNADWGELSAGPVSQHYPTRACSYDIYHFVPSSGYHGLFGVLRLGAKLEKYCAAHGAVSPASSTWNQPQDCFCFSELSNRDNNANCGSTVP